MINELTLLYLTFLKIGAFAFGGGYAVLPLIQKYVVNDMSWLTIAELTDLVSLSQITPGPIAINAATFIGIKVAGIPGALVATAAEVTPSCILMLVLGYFLFKGRKIKAMDNILKGLKPAIPGLIMIAAIDMFTSSVFSPEGIKYVGLVGFVVGGILFLSKRVDIIKIIVISASLGVLLHFLI